jgi:hypothetical protein
MKSGTVSGLKRRGKNSKAENLAKSGVVCFIIRLGSLWHREGTIALTLCESRAKIVRIS